MSIARPVFSRILASTTSSLRPTVGVRTFGSTPRTQFPRQRPQLNSADLVPSKPKSIAPYSAAEVEELKSIFTPEQLAALQVGEQAIDREDFSRRVPRREGDPYGLKYNDDLRTYDPILDFRPPGYVPKTKIKKASNGEVYIAPDQHLPKIQDPKYKYTDDSETSDTMISDLSAHTGMSVGALKNVRVRTLVVHSVTNQTRMGKIRKMYALAVAGNGDGLLGIGEGKAVEAEDAMHQATYMAIRNLEPIPRYEGRTIYGDVEVKQGAVEMKLFTRPPGFGVRCSSYIFEMCRCLGIQDLSARVTRSRNPMNVIKTFMKALKSQKLPETIARGRGKKFVDVRKVYYSGSYSNI